MTHESLSATVTIPAPAETVFAVIADPASHAAIDGTGWVRDPPDRQPLTAPGQVFRMAMYHPNHPNGEYEMANLVQVFDPPTAISWKPGYDPGNGELRFGGWTWRYDLAPLGPSETEVRLTYDWSAVPDDVRQTGPSFPPFPPDHLSNSLDHLAQLVPSRAE
jgi:Polyketide cyclase / dehydrase and lipid transport